MRTTFRGLLVLVHAYWQFFFYLLPLLLLAAISFWTIHNYQLTPAFTFDNYKVLLNSPVYASNLLTSLWLAVSTAVLATALALPLAYTIAFHVHRRWRGFLIFALLLPFFSSYIIRMFSWQLWLNDAGILAALLRGLGIVRGNLSLIYTGMAIRIGLLSVLVPITSLLIYVSLARIDRTLISAACDLGASSWQAFWHIILPFSLPGIAIAFLLSFIISMGDFVSPSILGGNQVYTLSILISDRVKIADWPTAAALGMVMLLISVALITAIFTGMRFLPTVRYGRSQAGGG